MKSNFKNGLLAALVFSLLAGNAVFADINSDVEHLQQRWAEINYQLEGKTQQSAFEQLMNEANAIAKATCDTTYRDRKFPGGLSQVLEIVGSLGSGGQSCSCSQAA